jgi:hypothetical protein
MQSTSIGRRRAVLLALTLVVALVAVGNAAAYRPLLEEGSADSPLATVPSGRPIPAELPEQDRGRDLVPLAVGIGAALLTFGTLAGVTRRRREPAAG